MGAFYEQKKLIQFKVKAGKAALLPRKNNYLSISS